MASLGVVGAVGIAPRVTALRSSRRQVRRHVAKSRVVATARLCFSRGANTNTASRDVRCAGFFDNLFGKKTTPETEPVESVQTVSGPDASRVGDDQIDPLRSSDDGDGDLVFTATETTPKPKTPPPPPQPMVQVKKTDFKTTMSALDALIPIDELALKKAREEAADELRADALFRERAQQATSAKNVEVSISPSAASALGGPKKGDGDKKESVDGTDLIARNLEKRKKQQQELGSDKKSKKIASPIVEGEEDKWLDTVVGGLSDAARADADKRTPEENAKLEKVLDELKDLAKRPSESRDGNEIRDKFDSLFEILDIVDEPAVSAADVQTLKDKVFGYSTFFVTSVEELGPEIAGEGILIKGNLRADRAAVWSLVQEKVETLFDGKYTPFILEEPGTEGDEPSVSGTFDSGDGTETKQNNRSQRISFLIVPSDKAGPNPNTSLWQYIVAFLLFGLTTGSAVQLGLVAEISRLPVETAEWLARGAAGLDTSLAPNELPPGLEGFDSQAYVEGAFPVFAGIFATAMAHEVGHTLAALVRNVKISLPFLIPNGQLGTFGSITQFKSIPKTREDLFDVAIAGPVAGSLVASALFAYGLSLSINGDPNDLLPIPGTLFNGSLLLGSIAKLFFGDADLSKGVLVHPLFVAGWCGLVTQALNMLPVGQIDGGRVTQTGFGRRALGATSLGVYLGLSLGVIASSISLSWGLYVLICQRTPEFSPQDDVTEVSPERQQVALLLIFLAITVLLPGVDVNSALDDVMPML